ncbi:hypothetical protein B9J78_00550 [bacterium Unc6]|nr:hypothetical protein [bacterium Unc6]
MKQQTLVIIKPDGLKKSLTGNVLTRLSETRLEIIGAKVARVSRQLAEIHYQHLKDRPFFEELISYIMGELHNRKKILALVYWGEDAIKKVKEVAGATNPEEADSVSIRGQYGRITTKGVYENVLHTSSNKQDAGREIKLWFKPDEIIIDIYPCEKIIKEKVEERVWK